ncbi:MAG: cupin domain-containing protein [Cyanobacteria bacterium P01_A01_bin.84]
MIIDPQQVPTQKTSTYPELFKSRVEGRIKQRLGDVAGLKSLGVNLVKLQPGSSSALRHFHSHEDEFIYVLEGEITLVTNAGSRILTPGMAAGFPAGEADAHHLINHSENLAIYLEVGNRHPEDEATYPDDDLIAKTNEDGRYFTRKNGIPYEG